jgi:hypothetical protein
MELVSTLSGSALKALSHGPLPESTDPSERSPCRLCDVLGPMTQVPAATTLCAWHEFFDETGALDELVKTHGGPTARDEWSRIAGELSYARACMVYLAASREIKRRQLRALEWA